MPESKTVVAASLLRWALTAGATLAMGFVAFTVCRKPFARWLMRVATNGRLAGGRVGGGGGHRVLHRARRRGADAGVRVRHQVAPRGARLEHFRDFRVVAAATPVYMEWRKRRRALLKKALTACFDVEKSPEGLAALMGAADARRDPAALVMGVSEAPGWARFREDELATWLNLFLARLWPFVNRSVCARARAGGAAAGGARPSSFKRIHFEKLDLGPEPIRVNAVRWVGERNDGMGASIELDLAWSAALVSSTRTASAPPSPSA